MRRMPLCVLCKHYYRFNEKYQYKCCEAYPNGIPEAVYWTGHFKPKPNDNGIQFEARDDVEDDIINRYREILQNEDELYRNYGKVPIYFTQPQRKSYSL